MPSTVLSATQVERLFAALLSEISSLGFTAAQAAVSAAGIFLARPTTQHWAPFRSAVTTAFVALDPEARLTALEILGGKLSEIEAVRRLLAQHGYEFVDGTFVPTALLDQREARYLPATSVSELAKAMKRLVAGDDTGAITSACGAVDSLMLQVFARQELAPLDPASIAFAAKVNTAISRLRIFEVMESELTAIGMKAADVTAIVTETRKATNHASQMLQSLRRSMGDVHGSKPALRQMAYDAIKWASAICALFEGR